MTKPLPSEDDEVRVYGRWAGNPSGHPEDTTRCIQKVFGGIGSPGSYQCSRPRGHGPDGLYCKQHSSETVAKKMAERSAKLASQRASMRRQWAIDEARSVIVKTAVDHFDQKSTFDELEKAVIEYRKLIG